MAGSDASKSHVRPHNTCEFVLTISKKALTLRAAFASPFFSQGRPTTLAVSKLLMLVKQLWLSRLILKPKALCTVSKRNSRRKQHFNVALLCNNVHAT